MNKEQCLELIKLLSALESWSFAKDRGTIPDYLIEDLNNAVDMLTKEILDRLVNAPRCDDYIEAVSKSQMARLNTMTGEKK